MTTPRTPDRTFACPAEEHRSLAACRHGLHNLLVVISLEEHRSLFTNIRARPGMWLIRKDFATVIAFVTGYEEAHSRTLLTGFREWLVTQVGCRDQHVWWDLTAYLTEPVGQKTIRDMDPDLDARAVSTLFDLLDEFLELRQEHDGLRRIYAAYEEWHQLRKQNSCIAGGAASCPTVIPPRAASRTPSTTTDQPPWELA